MLNKKTETTIDTPEFRRMLNARFVGTLLHKDFIAHIDQWGAALAEEARREADEAHHRALVKTEMEARNAGYREGYAASTEAVERMLAQRTAGGDAVPYEAIGKILNEVMAQATANGANSVSMPDEYVAVAHFLAYPDKYAAQPVAEAAAQAAHCHKCGLPMVTNPHPDAGKPESLLDVGCPTECLPCLVKNRHGWANRANAAQAELRALKEAAAQADDAQGEKFCVGVHAHEHAVAISIMLKRGDITHVVYGQSHPLNRETAGIGYLPAAPTAQPTQKMNFGGVIYEGDPSGYVQAQPTPPDDERAKAQAALALLDRSYYARMVDCTRPGYVCGDISMKHVVTVVEFARAALRQPGALPDVCAQMRALCSACGGTGDVTSITGEWRGACDCEASKPGALPDEADDAADPIRELISVHGELLEGNDYCYFELARHRRTGWMAWLCTNAIESDPNRIVLACGQGDTPDEACRGALDDRAARALAAKQAGK